MGIFSGNHTCPLPSNEADLHIKAEPIVGSLTFQHLAAIIAAGCTGITLFLSLWLIIKHLHRYTFPSQQRQIIRIIFTPVIFAVFSLLSIIFYDAAPYLTPITDLYEVFALAAIFILFSDYVTPDNTTSQRFSYFNSLPAPNARYQTKFITVFTNVVINIICFIAEEASLAAGTYCATSLKPYFANLWITIITNVSITVAVLAVLNLYKRLKPIPDFSQHKPLLKLISFKLIVFLNFIQGIVFSVLTGQNLLHGSHKTTGKDLTIGIPALIVAVEQVFFAIFFHYSFRSREYHEDVLQKQGLQVRRKGTLAAALEAMNPMDVIMGIVTSIQLLLSGGFKQGTSSQTEKFAMRGRGRYTQVEGTSYHPYGQQSVEEEGNFLQPNVAAGGERSRSPSASPPLYQPPTSAPPGRYEEYRRERSRSREVGDYAVGARDMV